VNRRQEAGSDQDPNCEVNYEGDSSDESSQVPAEIKNVITPVAAIQINITPSAEFRINLASEAAEIQRDLIPAVAEFQSSLRPTAAEFQIILAKHKSDPEIPPSGNTIHSSRVASTSASPQPISNGSNDKAEVLATRQERSIEHRAKVLNRRVLKSADIMRLVKAKDIRVTRRHNHNL
jgi:hypothetical protein